MKVVDDHICKVELLLLTALLKAALHNTAAMLVRADLDTVMNACLKDELSEALKALATLLIRLLRVLRCFEDAKEGLDHMVTMGVLKTG